MTRTANTQPAFIAQIATAVAAYRDATGSDKANVRRDANATMQAALLSGDFDAAQAWAVAIRDDMVPAKPTPVAPDYEVILADRAATLYAALVMIQSGTVPTGIPAGTPVPSWDNVKQRADEIMRGTAGTPEGDLANVAHGIATTKVTRSTERNSIADVVARAFAATGADSLTVAEVARHGATDTYKPSSGAVAARFFGGSGVAGYVAIEADANGPRRIAVVGD